MNILTLKIGNKYGPEYVNKLFRGISRNTSVDFNFYCYTEDPTGLDEGINIIPLVEKPLVKKQWYKIDFHNMPQFEGQKCLILDIDLVIVKNIDSILEVDLPHQHLGGFRIWWHKGTDLINGGFQMFWQGETKHLYTKFYSDVDYWQEYYIKIGKAEPPVNGEQHFVSYNCNMPYYEFPKGEYVKYAARTLGRIQRIWKQKIDNSDFIDSLGNLNNRIKMVHFCNADNYIHHHNKLKIVKRNWL